MAPRAIRLKPRRKKSHRARTAVAARDDATTERILDAARRIFFRFGFARTTMDDLAAELGMSKKTLYQHFGSKEALVDALISLKGAAAVAGFEALLDAPAKSFAERVHAAMHHMLCELGEISPLFLHDLRRLTPKLYARLEELRRQNLPRLWRRMLEAGIATGAVRPDINVAFAAQFFMLSVQTMMLPENLDHLQLAPSGVVANLFDLSFGGLLTSAGLKDYEKNRSVITIPTSLV